ncbi:hypothetical protein [Hyphomicrobium sp. ghe19]|uniref:hypothetical protein n=1 Tax=Hyphomicrobium sp. ghe19 TaxID=2682968 RepID=UPI001366D0E5|nr:hypothetical protein HYPP_03816 [Hyphomicrobium sp. ghe19]
MSVEFRPMAELKHTNPVDMRLADGRVVTGWLFQGIPNEPRSYWTHDFGRGSSRIYPEAWREPQSTGDADCSSRRLAA